MLPALRWRKDTAAVVMAAVGSPPAENAIPPAGIAASDGPAAIAVGAPTAGPGSWTWPAQPAQPQPCPWPASTARDPASSIAAQVSPVGPRAHKRIRAA